jgi:putative N-acetyltransferase (TIGR04045 family)
VSAADIAVRWTAQPLELAGALALREEVFCGEQGVSREEELDGRDEQALHLVALVPGKQPAEEPGEERVIGTLRVLFEGSRAKVGRVAVQRDWRGQGIASRMLESALAVARERGCEEVRLAAQMQATSLYARAGFRVESEPFEEAGISHVWMGLRLADED